MTEVVSGDHLLIDPHPRRHIVYPHKSQAKALDAVSLFTYAGVARCESVILIAANSQFASIMAKLAQGGLSVHLFESEGQVTCISAEDLLGDFFHAGRIKVERFLYTAASLIFSARKHSPSRRVRIFGEMVSLLLDRDEIAAAEELEKLWNEAIDIHNVSLLCGYSLANTRHRILPESLTSPHSHCLRAKSGLLEAVEVNG